MIPDPLHPAVVHFPIVLAVLFPLFVGGAFWSMRRGTGARRAWILPTLVAAALAGSAWLSVETGESQGDRVERIVGERAMESHEELAETFLTMAAIVAGVAAAGLAAGFVGRAARALTVVGSLALVGVVIPVGHTGGQLVYRHGAASAYTSAGGSTQAAATRGREAGNE
jgi:uncharacterized membrane protein